MNKNVIFSILGVLILAVSGYYVFFSKNGDGKVLGTSINSFYSQKINEIDPPPKKNSNTIDPVIRAGSAILVHEPSKYFLYSKNSDQKVPIASITKIMTAIITLENYKLTDIIEIKSDSTNVTPSVMNLVPGERITVENLMYGLLLNSGNDAALALSSSKMPLDSFVSLMNKKANELGLENSIFKDPAGLDDNGVSSARDVAILFSYALKIEEIEKLISTAKTEVKSVDETVTHKLENSNRLTTGEIPLDGVIGGKTGYTPDAGHTLVCAASRNNQLLISVVLNTTSNSPSASAEETKKLLTWGFNSFQF